MSEKSKSTTFLLCYFLGLLGAHRFYLKRWITAALMLLTAGGLGIWWLIDTVLIMGGKFTDADDNPLRTGAIDANNPQAGFWVRLAAVSVDMIIVQLVVMVLVFVGVLVLGTFSVLATTDDPAAIERVVILLSYLTTAAFVVTVPLYFALQTASGHQATVGKRVFEIRVIANSGDKLNLMRSLWRAVSYLLSALPLYLGFILAAFTTDKRALHDYLAGSKVIYASPAARDSNRQAVAQHTNSATTTSSSATPGATGNLATHALIGLGVLLLAGAAALALL